MLWAQAISSNDVQCALEGGQRFQPVLRDEYVVLYAHATGFQSPAAALAEQHLGGVIMLVVGGASYLFGGVWLAARMLRTAHSGGAAVPRQEIA